MSPLEAFQSQMAAALLGSADPPAALRADGIPAALRFGIHRNNVLSSLVRTIEAAFPATRAWLGDALFRSLAASFVQIHPPSWPRLSAYGGAFPHFVARHAHGPRSTAAASLARFEWIRQVCYFAADAPRISAEDLRAVPSEDHARLGFVLHPAAQVRAFPFDVLGLWQACMEGEANGDAIEARSQILLVRRFGGDIVCHEISAGEAAMLDAVAAGEPLGRAVELGWSLTPDLDLTKTLAELLGQGVFCDVYVDDGVQE